MKTPTWRDAENLSAYLDGKLSGADRTRLETRLRSEPELKEVFDDLRQARDILRKTPRRGTPRNFILTPKMAGIRPPVPRLVPALSWASAVATLAFLVTMGAGLLGQLAPGAAAPMMAAAPATGGYGIGGGPAATQPPSLDNALATPTPENGLMLMSVPQEVTPTPELLMMGGGGEATLEPANPPGESQRNVAPPAPKAAAGPVNTLPWLLLGLAVVLIAAALLVRLFNVRAFRRRTK